MKNYAANESLSLNSFVLIFFKSNELNKCWISRTSSSPFNKLTSEASRSSTKSSKLSWSEFTIKNYFCNYHRIIDKSQQKLDIISKFFKN